MPTRDPWLRGSDRNWLLGTNTDRREEVYKSLGAPGVVLVDGEITGTWRQRQAWRKLDIEISPWRRLTDAERT